MSSFTEEKIECPNCHKESSFTIFQSVNVDLHPNLKAKVFDGSLFKWTCPGCGNTYNVHYPFLYHDMTNNFMVRFPSGTPTALMVEYIRIRESHTDEKAVNDIKKEYADSHPNEMILFEELMENGDLKFEIYEMVNSIWQDTCKKYITT